MSQWDDLRMDSRISQVLDVQSHDKKNNYGRPFLTPHQIALRFKALFPHEFSILGRPIESESTAKQDSLVQYIAQRLTKRIKDQIITDIEECCLYQNNLHSLQYDSGEHIIDSSPAQAHGLSLYRLRNH